MTDTNGFDAGSFSDIAHTELGKQLWDFLGENDSTIRMETAAYLSRPSLEPLQPFLLSRFGDDVRSDRVKQMVGRMVRQKMEARGYVLEQVGVKVRTDDLFGTAARYKKR